MVRGRRPAWVHKGAVAAVTLTLAALTLPGCPHRSAASMGSFFVERESRKHEEAIATSILELSRATEQAKALNLRSEIEVTEQLLENERHSVDHVLRMQLTARLGLALEDLSDLERALAAERYDAAMRACVDRGAEDCHDAVVPDFAASEEAQCKALFYYRLVIKRYPQSEEFFLIWWRHQQLVEVSGFCFEGPPGEVP